MADTVKHFWVITNRIKDPEGTNTNRIVDYIRKNNGTAVCVEDKKPEETPECVIVLGGDGTLLQAARDMMECDVPLLGINLGTLGYLAEVDMEHVEEALDRIMQDDFLIEERMTLSGSIQRTPENTVTEQNFALNDIVISRCGSLRILTFQIYVNGQFLYHYSADGMLVATPTGSTGYNMSAGGPIVEPMAQLLLLTPICPHTLNTRSIILAAEDEIRIEIPIGRDGKEQEVEASFDGSHKVMLKTGDSIVIRRSQKKTGIVKLNSESFLAVMHRKMSE